MMDMEMLEGRVLMAVTIPANINLTRMRGSQSEGAIAIDPNNSNRIFILSNIDRGDGLFTTRSSNGGKSWSKQIIADGSDDLEPACCDSSTAFDEFGNLFIGYINTDTDRVIIARSSDGGQSFTEVDHFSG